MKKLFLLFLMIPCMSAMMFSQVTVHLSGTVLRDSTNIPVVGHEVIITADSNGAGYSYWAQRFTSSTGQYDCTITNAPGGVEITFLVKTKNCDSTIMVQSFQTSNSPAVVNFLLCNTQPANCEAGFTAYADSLDALRVHFQDISTPAGQIVSRLWNFGDGTTATTGDPWHTFAAAGVYHVCLTITTTGCHNTKCVEMNIGQVPVPCEARFEFSHDTLNTAPFTYHFFDTSTGNPTSWEWHFGDPASGTSNVSHEQNPTHAFLTANVYNVCLSIHGDSCQSSKCDSIQVGIAPVNCESYFTYSKNFLTVNFESHINSTDSITYAWNFGDIHSGSANFSTERDPVHVFSYDDHFNVTLTTTTPGGCSWTSTQTVFVSYTCDVNGAVSMGNTFVDHGRIELIRVDSGNVMTVVDSHEFGDSLGMYWFGGVAPGHYYLLAQLLPSSSRYGDFVPTYFEEAINWTNAHLIELGQTNNPYNFHLVEAITPTPGNGIINGTVTQGTKVNTGGTPAQNVEVLLLDPSNKPLEVTYTDASGHFAFNSIAMGNYIVYPELAGLTTSPASVTLDNTHSTASTPFSMYGQQIAYGINDQLPLYINGIGEFYPNPPANGMASLNVSVSRELELNLSLYDQAGQVVREFRSVMHKGDNVLRLGTASLANGPYYLKISTTDGGSATRKLFIVQ
ncbi:MAG: PKD domain-containing protein [Bacteroidetes bacterium]|nr:PKD domain-containing protein [Bacteroidota bacterium]